MVSTVICVPVSIDLAAESSIACITAGTPAMTMTLPMRKPGGGETGLSTSSAPTGMRAMRRRAALSSSAL